MKRPIVRLAIALAVAAAGVAGLQATSASQTRGADAISANRYTISIDGYEIGTFAELAGINSEVETAEYWESSDSGVVLNKLPGKVKPPTITLKRGLNSSLEMWAWHEAVRNGQMATARRSCTLTMFNSEGKPVAKYWLEKAWPSKMDLAGLKAGASEALIETVVLTAERIQRLAP